MCDLRLYENKMGWGKYCSYPSNVGFWEQRQHCICLSMKAEIPTKLFTKLEKSFKVLFNQSTSCITSWQYILYIIWTIGEKILTKKSQTKKSLFDIRWWRFIIFDFIERLFGQMLLFYHNNFSKSRFFPNFSS